MLAIVDTLILGREELALIKAKYPGCHVKELRKSLEIFREYRIAVEGEDEESYYHFLIDNVIALSSRNFCSKLKSDRRFADAMRRRINAITPEVVAADGPGHL